MGDEVGTLPTSRLAWALCQRLIPTTFLVFPDQREAGSKATGIWVSDPLSSLGSSSPFLAPTKVGPSSSLSNH